ncbi:MAG TPA: type II toxin-antitoxin system RelE/ParE family toxin [Vineibacter sp.]|nr:type II toxin-antitoxin system RelE/ParE family toxin [Vineibacter sp.]
MQTVVETPDCLRDAKAARVADDERWSIVDYVAAHPRAADLIVGSGGARKVRFAAPGRGKSGGYRVVTHYGGGHLPVFLLNVFKKGDRVNLSRAEIDELREGLSHLAREYREGVLRHVKGR